MKKMAILAVAVLAMAFSAQALTFRWQSTVASQNALGGTLSGTLVYIVMTSLGTAAPVWDAGTMDFVNPGNYTIYGAGLVGTDGRIAAINQSTTGNWIAGTTMNPANSGLLPDGRPKSNIQVPLAGTLNRRNYYLVFFDAATLKASTLYAVKAHTTTAGLSPAAVNSEPFIVSFGSGTGVLPADWQPIPEPLTLSLVAAGVGAIALRRRMFKK